MSAAGSAAEAAALVTALSDIRMVNMAAAGATAWVCYDIFLTFGQEVAYIWKGRWSTAKIFYLISRYYSLTHLIVTLSVVTKPQHSTHVCRGWQWFSAYSGPIISTAAVHVLLIMRLYAIYGHDYRMLFLLSSLYLINISVSILAIVVHLLIPVTTQTAISVAAVVLRGIQTIPQSAALPISGCLANGDPRSNLLLVAWIPKIVIDLIFFVLTLVKFIQVVRRLSGTTLSTIFREGNKLAPLLTLFVKDGAVWFVVVFASDLQASYFAIAHANGPLENMGVAWLVATVAIASSRLVLRLRGTTTGVGGVGLTSLEHLELSDVFKPSTALADATVPFQTVPASGERPATKPL
ncbi:hypothetical protein JB92DRAFT_3094941 [Gautieria morchelliformis]|nr:hypothetical protein JB92DRAFT_3094941 [Gautieria morchelliformis]